MNLIFPSLVFLKKFDITMKFVQSEDPADFAAAIDEKTKGIYVESIGNPKNTVAPLPELAKVGDFLFSTQTLADIFNSRLPMTMAFLSWSITLLAWEVGCYWRSSGGAGTDSYKDTWSDPLTMEPTSSHTAQRSGSADMVQSSEES